MNRQRRIALIAPPALLALPWLTAAAATPAAVAASSQMRVRRLPWAGILVEAGATALFVDAVPAEPTTNSPSDLFTTRQPTKSALVTHHHTDHFSRNTLAAILGDDGLLVVYKDVLQWLDTRGLRVQAVDLWEPIFFPRAGSDIVAFALPAVDGFGAPQVSWVVDGGGKRIFHGGDTQWHGRWADIGRAYGPFDAAFLPINGARQNIGRFVDTGVPAVLTPEQAVKAASLLRARLLVPIHFGEPDPPAYVEIDRPAERLVDAAKAAGLQTQIAQSGEWIELK